MPRFVLLPLLSLAIPTTAAAAELQYEAPPGCPTESDVQKRLEQHAPNRGSVGLIVHSDEREGGFLANVVVGMDAVRRELRGRTCESVVDAAVLVAALAGETPAPAMPSAPDEPARIEAKPAASPENARSSVELAVGVTASAREFSRALQSSTAFGGGLFVETSAPALWASWYRPSARLGFQYLSLGTSSATVTSISNPQVVVMNVEDHFFGGTLDVCPLGVAPISTRLLDLTFAACATSNIGDVGDLWADVGGLARAQAQIGRKTAVRGFFDVSAGYLGRLTGGGPTEVAPTISNPHSGTFGYPARTGMWTFALGGGVLFP